jgi:AcrR family transcriptional regulator
MTTDTSPFRPMTNLRADARRNRERILAAARDVFVELGPEAPLDEIAVRAGVGIGTLYRRFPDRRSLMRAVVLDVLERVMQEAELALTEEPDAASALARYMHRALDLRVSAVIPTLLGQVALDDEELLRVRQRSSGLIERMIEQAQVEGMLRPDVAFGDIALLLVRMSRPLPGPFSRALENDLVHRHLDLLLDGLLTGRDRAAAPLPGPAMTLGDLQALPSARHSDDD